MEYIATDLPGKSLYDQDFSVQIRRITPIEQKYILSLSQKDQKTTKDYMNFLKKLIIIDNPTVKFEDLYWYDIQYLLYRIRHITYAKYPIKLGFKCDECGTMIHHDLNIGQLDIKEPEHVQKTIVLDNLGELPIRNKVVGDDLVIEEFAKKHNIDIIEDLQMRLLLLDLCLISKTKTLDELYDLAESGELTANDIITIEQWFEDSVWGVDEKATVTCPKCKKEASKGYLLSIEDFFSII